MPLGTYDIGDKPVITAVFTDINDAGGISTAVLFTVRKPGGTQVEYTGASPEVGNDVDNEWTLILPRLDVSGRWVVRAESTAGLQAADEDTFNVRVSQIETP